LGHALNLNFQSPNVTCERVSYCDLDSYSSCDSKSDFRCDSIICRIDQSESRILNVDFDLKLECFDFLSLLNNFFKRNYLQLFIIFRLNMFDAKRDQTFIINEKRAKIEIFNGMTQTVRFEKGEILRVFP